MTSERTKDIIGELTQKHGSDFLDYEKCKEIYESLRNEKKQIEIEVAKIRF